MPKHTPPPTVIEIDPPRGVRGRLERLFIEYNTKAQALRIAAEVLDEDDRRQAREAAPKKFLAAMNHRNGSAGRPTMKPARALPAPKPSKPPISGKRLSLFLLEHTSEEKPRTIADLRAELITAGSITNDARGISSTLGAVLTKIGCVKRTRDGDFRRTARGTRKAAELRRDLEAAGAVIPGGYLEPSSASA